ncbi:MAG TPA: hypothetical protein VM638_09500 [Actinomycetota bacterium]|nr:hypothetical protein [Actinomycetota bacterium]
MTLLGGVAPATASGARPHKGSGSTPHEELRRAVSCQQLSGRCVGLAPLLPASEESLDVDRPAAPTTAPDGSGAVCQTPGLPSPVQDDWCERWMTKRGLGPHGVTEVPRAAATSTDGSEVYVLAHAATSDPLGAGILAFDAATGAWRRTIPVPYRFLGPQSEFFSYLLATGDDLLVVSGYVRVRVETPDGFTRQTNFLTVAYSPTGELRWWSRYEGPMSGRGADHGDWPGSLTISPDGAQVIVTGISTRPGDYQPHPWYRDLSVAPDEVATISYDTSTGSERWLERFDTGDLEFTYGMTIGPRGDALYINTMSWEFESTVLAYGDLGHPEGPDLLWSHAEDPSSFLAPVAIASTSDGVVVGGYSLSNPSGTLDYGVVALDAHGKVRWRANHSNVYTILGTDYTSSDIPVAMATDGDRIYVTGYAFEWDAAYAIGDPSPSIIGSTVAFDVASGALAWQRIYRFPGHRAHFPTSIHTAGGRVYVPAMDSECNFYVRDASYYCKSTTINLVTLDIDASTGAVRRVARFNHARSVALPALQPSLPTAPGFNIFGTSDLHPDTQQMTIAALLDSPCIDTCLPGARYRMGLISYDGS